MFRVFEHSDLGFVSNFEFRASNFPVYPGEENQ